MKFKLFWKKLKAELKNGKTFDTLYQHKQFNACNLRNEISIIPEISRVKRSIREKDFRAIWEFGLTLSEKQKFHPTFYNHEMVHGRTVAAAYIVALIDVYLKKFNSKWE